MEARFLQVSIQKKDQICYVASQYLREYMKAVFVSFMIQARVNNYHMVIFCAVMVPIQAGRPYSYLRVRL